MHVRDDSVELVLATMRMEFLLAHALTLLLLAAIMWTASSRR